ncbi:NUDIX hydrolase domain-like protein [Cantharellus anzutake]|uniref:NUDIX hydrolase domain-like protein n=1 Tax=Cantharellus anzutake TaxID=1750568 RepID=UPI001908B282|nr:NUDIX hydrolase domain-like protein [Cantharellus anzutake]KAF8314335.1 NUDIX hydrolase domain-like protein [Cantharellus anzutake]
MDPKSLLPIVEHCDNFSVRGTTEILVPFYVTPPEGVEIIIGWIRAPVFRTFLETGKAVFDVSESGVRFVSELDSFEKRNVALATLCEMWHRSGFFSDIIGGRLWRNELYPIYYNPFKRRFNVDIAFVLERTCCTIFGLVTHGCHMTMYLEGEQKIWVPTRAKTKQTWPGYLDNSAAGGIPYGLTPTEALVKECLEEASLEENFVREYVRAAGAISYFYQTSNGWLQPEVQYVYDLVVPAGVNAPEPKPSDGEVEHFELLSIDHVLDRLGNGLFKPNCALVLIDFFIRHGHITPELEPNFLEILTRIHGRFGY